MLTPEENARLCCIGPGTEMGQFVRRFWVPACPSSRLPQDRDPVRIRLFGENLVAFRGDDGQVGILDEGCPHRGASLVAARQEGCALRCLFHGWKINAEGRILETPNMPDGAFKERVRARSYPVEEAAGLIWTYLGPPAVMPPRPRYLWEALPDDQVLVIDVDLDCNWVQSLEGLVDSAHAGILHADILANTMPQQVESDGAAIQAGLIPKIEVERTDFGLHYAAIRPGVGEGGVDQVRITAYAAPFLCFIPPAGMAFIPVPIDDTHTKFYNLWWSETDRLDSGPAHDACRRIWGLEEDLLRATGMFPLMPPAGPIPPRNVFDQNRAGMRAGTTFSGLRGITSEDAVCAVVAGPILDRSKEHLVPSDLAVIKTRRLLLDSAGALAENGSWLFGTKTPAADIAAASGDLTGGMNWRDFVPSHVPFDPTPSSEL